MLQSVINLKGDDIIAVNSKIVNIKEFYLDDQDLIARYVIADIGN